MNFDLGEVLTRAWQITWKNKVLWVITALPFLLAFLFFPFWLYFVFTQDFNPNQIERWVENPMFVIVGGFLYILLIGGSLILRVISNASVTLGTYKVEALSQSITFMDLLKDGFQYFWKILGVILLISLGILVFFLAFFACIAALSLVTMGLATICIQPLFLLMVPFIWLVTVVMEQAEAAVIVDGMGVTDSIKRGYELVRSNLGRYALIILIIYLGMSVLSSLIIFPFMIPMFIFMMRSMESANMDFSGMMKIQAVFGIVVFPIMAVVQGFVLTYLKSAMMVIYLRLTRSTGEPQPILQEATA